MLKKTYERKIPTVSEERKHAEKIGSGNSIEPRNKTPELIEEDDENSNAPQNGFLKKAGGEKKRKSGMGATEYAMFLVSGGSYTEKAFLLKIRSKEKYTEEEISEALGYVKKFGYIDDKRLADNMIDKLAGRLWGRSKICYYLRSKGIDDEIIEGLDFSEIDFVSYCSELIKRQHGKPKEKIMRTLYNAGYTSGEIRMAFDLTSV